MTTLLGIDIGTSACKVALFGTDGQVIRQASEDYPVHYPQPGWAEQSPDDWWRAVVRAVRRVLEGQSPAGIAGIGVDGQSWSAILVDSTGDVLCNTPIWMDTRAQAECRELTGTLGADALFALSGNPVMPSYSLPKLLWYRRHLPDSYARAAAVLQSNSFIVYRLTGRLTQDRSQGYGHACYDIGENRWDEAVIRALGLSPALFPPVFASDAVVGAVTAEAAALTGLLAGTPVVAGGLDAACGSLGAGVYHAGQTQEQGGQAGGMSICMDRAVADPRLILSAHVVPGCWLLQGGTVGGGGTLRWLRAQLGEALSFEDMSALAETVPPGSEGVLFLPYMAGERSPIWNPQARGVLFGLDYGKGRAHLIRAAMEGVAYSLRHNLQVAREAGADVGEMHAMGGSANSRVWTQIKADATGRALCVPASDTATTLGAALLAGVGTGVWPDYAHATADTVRVTRRHDPNPDNAPAYDAGYAAYRALYDRLLPMMGGDDT